MSKRLSAARLAEIKAREQAADQGPWEVVGIGHIYGPAVDPDGDDERHWLADTKQCDGSTEINAAFLAAARQDIPDLLAEIERLQGLITQAEWEEVDFDTVQGQPKRRCPWCRGAEWRGHMSTCPAFGSEA
jgi:hypothetical protein